MAFTVSLLKSKATCRGDYLDCKLLDLLDDGHGEIEVEHYEHCYRSWVDYAEEYLISAPGVWTHELDQANRQIGRAHV